MTTDATALRAEIARVEPMDPQPPHGIRYLVGNQSWLKPEDRTPLTLVVEQWGNLGPMELDPSIRPNRAGFRVRELTFLAPAWARGFATRSGLLVWTSEYRHGGDIL